MSEGTNEPTEITVPVGDYGPGGYPDYVTFRGTEIRRVPAVLEYRDDFDRTRHYTLYETPGEGLKIHELETIREGSMERQPGQRSAAVGEVAGRLFTEGELRRERPEIAQDFFGAD
jgi:hypothetical protein